MLPNKIYYYIDPCKILVFPSERKTSILPRKIPMFTSVCDDTVHMHHNQNYQCMFDNEKQVPFLKYYY